MSSGNGKIERAVLDCLRQADLWLDAYQLAALAYQKTPAADGVIYVTPSQLVCVKRALASLKRKGAPITIAGRENQRALWMYENPDNCRYDWPFDLPKKTWTPKVIVGGRT